MSDDYKNIKEKDMRYEEKREHQKLHLDESINDEPDEPIDHSSEW